MADQEKKPKEDKEKENHPLDISRRDFLKRAGPCAAAVAMPVAIIPPI
jgi:hypothetical protein